MAGQLVLAIGMATIGGATLIGMVVVALATIAHCAYVATRMAIRRRMAH